MRIPFIARNDEEEAQSLQDYAQLPEEGQENRMNIMIEKLEGLSHVDRIMRKVRDGNIVIASIKGMKETNTEELRHCISRMKTACMGIEGDIAGAGDEWLIITPAAAAIHREPQALPKE